MSSLQRCVSERPNLQSLVQNRTTKVNETETEHKNFQCRGCLEQRLFYFENGWSVLIVSAPLCCVGRQLGVETVDSFWKGVKER
jgi:hypothetical protein